MEFGYQDLCTHLCIIEMCRTVFTKNDSMFVKALKTQKDFAVMGSLFVYLSLNIETSNQNHKFPQVRMVEREQQVSVTW